MKAMYDIDTKNNYFSDPVSLHKNEIALRKKKIDEFFTQIKNGYKDFGLQYKRVFIEFARIIFYKSNTCALWEDVELANTYFDNNIS
jgi:hypothetical protein